MAPVSSPGLLLLNSNLSGMSSWSASTILADRRAKIIVADHKQVLWRDAPLLRVKPRTLSALSVNSRNPLQVRCQRGHRGLGTVPAKMSVVTKHKMTCLNRRAVRRVAEK